MEVWKREGSKEKKPLQYCNVPSHGKVESEKSPTPFFLIYSGSRFVCVLNVSCAADFRGFSCFPTKKVYGFPPLFSIPIPFLCLFRSEFIFGPPFWPWTNGRADHRQLVPCFIRAPKRFLDDKLRSRGMPYAWPYAAPCAFHLHETFSFYKRGRFISPGFTSLNFSSAADLCGFLSIQIIRNL